VTGRELDSSGSGLGLVTGFCEHGSEHSVTQQAENFLLVCLLVGWLVNDLPH
jgi:hypothetical protein